MTRWLVIGAAAAAAVVMLAVCGGSRGGDGPATTSAPPTTARPATSSTTTTESTSTTTTPASTTSTAPPTTVAAAPTPPVGCLLIDDARDVLVEIGADGDEELIGRVEDPSTGEPPLGPDATDSQLEAMATAPDGTVYAAAWGVVGTVDPATAEFTAIADTGLSDIDGLAFDDDGRLWATARVANASDRLVAIDPRTGRADDIGRITGPGVLADVDDLAFEPGTGVLYGVSNHAGDVERTSVLITIDPLTGDAASVGTDLEVADVEGLAFSSDGRLWATTGERGGSALFLVDPELGSATGAAVLGGGFGDYEAITCPAG